MQLRDICPSSFDPPLSLSDVLKEETSGPPGKLYSDTVLSCLKTGGSCARIVLEDGSSNIETQHFITLREQLEAGKLVSPRHTLVVS